MKLLLQRMAAGAGAFLLRHPLTTTMLFFFAIISSWHIPAEITRWRIVRARMLARENPEAALQVMDRIVASRPNDPLVLDERARQRSNAGEHDGAIEDILNAIELTSSPPPAEERDLLFDALGLYGSVDQRQALISRYAVLLQQADRHAEAAGVYDALIDKSSNDALTLAHYYNAAAYCRAEDGRIAEEIATGLVQAETAIKIINDLMDGQRQRGKQEFELNGYFGEEDYQDQRRVTYMLHLSMTLDTRAWLLYRRARLPGPRSQADRRADLNQALWDLHEAISLGTQVQEIVENDPLRIAYNDPELNSQRDSTTISMLAEIYLHRSEVHESLGNEDLARHDLAAAKKILKKK